MKTNIDLIRRGLTDAPSLYALRLAEWDLLIRQARGASVLGRLHAALDEANALDAVPAAARAHLDSARLIATSQESVIRWEVRCIQKALASAHAEFCLLKGAAYVLSGFAFARGRTQSD